MAFLVSGIDKGFLGLMDGVQVTLLLHLQRGCSGVRSVPKFHCRNMLRAVFQ